MYLKTNVGKIDELVHRMAESYGADIADEYICDDNEMYPDSCSMYYVLQYGLAKKKIRISDHTQQHKNVAWQKDIKSITVGDDTSFRDIERFLTNRINEIKRGSLFAALDYISKCA